MPKPILVAAAIATLAALTLGFDAQHSPASAAPNYCKHRYNICLARCPAANRRCPTRCQSQYRHCNYPMPYLGDLL
jgi:hypothetical protein